MGWDKDYLHYTNADNPFGDANLLSTFVWSKKLAKDGLAEVTNEELERLNRRKQEENKLELEKVRNNLRYSFQYTISFLFGRFLKTWRIPGEKETARKRAGEARAGGSYDAPAAGKRGSAI